MNKTSLLIALTLVLPVTVFAAAEATTPPKTEVQTANEQSACPSNKDMAHKEMMHKELMDKMNKMMDKMDKMMDKIDQDEKAAQLN